MSIPPWWWATISSTNRSSAAAPSASPSATIWSSVAIPGISSDGTAIPIHAIAIPSSVCAGASRSLSNWTMIPISMLWP